MLSQFVLIPQPCSPVLRGWKMHVFRSFISLTSISLTRFGIIRDHQLKWEGHPPFQVKMWPKTARLLLLLWSPCSNPSTTMTFGGEHWLDYSLSQWNRSVLLTCWMCLSQQYVGLIEMWSAESSPTLMNGTRLTNASQRMTTILLSSSSTIGCRWWVGDSGMCAMGQWMRTIEPIRTGVKRGSCSIFLFTILIPVVCPFFHCTLCLNSMMK